MKPENETLRPKFHDLFEPTELELRDAELLSGELHLLNDAVPADGRNDAVGVTDAADAKATVKFKETLDRRQEVGPVGSFWNPLITSNCELK